MGWVFFFFFADSVLIYFLIYFHFPRFRFGTEIMNSCIIAFLSWMDWQKYRLLYILYCILFTMVLYKKYIHIRNIWNNCPSYILWELQCLAQSVEYFEVTLWLALYGVCIEAKQVIIKKNKMLEKKYKRQSWFTWTQTTSFPLVTGHLSCSEWDHTHSCLSLPVPHLFICVGVGRLWLNCFMSSFSRCTTGFFPPSPQAFPGVLMLMYFNFSDT